MLKLKKRKKMIKILKKLVFTGVQVASQQAFQIVVQIDLKWHDLKWELAERETCDSNYTLDHNLNCSPKCDPNLESNRDLNCASNRDRNYDSNRNLNCISNCDPNSNWNWDPNRDSNRDLSWLMFQRASLHLRLKKRKSK